VKIVLLMSLICLASLLLSNGADAVSKIIVKSDGKKDASSAIQKALMAAAANGGGEVFLPAGEYRLDNHISIPTGVTLSGTWKTPHHGQNTGGTVLLAYANKGEEDGKPLISLNPSSAIMGVTIYYPEQHVPGVVPYPWTIQGHGMHGSVENVTLVNSYKGIDFGTHKNELHYIRNVFGCPLKMGVYVDRCTDIGRVENVHFNPHYWGRSGATPPPDWKALREYLYLNCIAFDIAFSDWEMFVNTFCFGNKIGYRFRNNTENHLGCNGSFLAIAADATWRSVLVEDSRPYGLLITNGQFVSWNDAESALEVAKTNTGVVQLSNCSFWGHYDRVALIDGKGAVSLNQCNFQTWDSGDKGVSAIEALGGDLIVQSCQFQMPKKQIHLGPDVTTAVIQGNRLTGSEMIENKSKGDVKMGMNVVRKLETLPTPKL
jgi:hypothetical protein